MSAKTGKDIDEQPGSLPAVKNNTILVGFDPDETNKSKQTKQISGAALWTFDGSDWVFKNVGQGNNISVIATDTGGNPINMIQCDPDNKVVIFPAEAGGIGEITGDTSDFDVTGYKGIFVNMSGGDVTISGLSGGVDGQTIHIFKPSSLYNLTIKNNIAGASTKILTATGADRVYSVRGGGLFIRKGNWYEIGI